MIFSLRDRVVSRIGSIRPAVMAGPATWEWRFGPRRTALALAVAAEMFSFFLNASFSVERPHSYARFIDIADAPFGPVDARNLVFPEYRTRILGPVLAYMLGLRGKVGTVIPLLGSVPLYYCAYLTLRRRIHAQAATAAVFLLATTLVTMSSRIILGMQDTLACLAIMLSLYFKSPAALCAAMFLGMFADERAAAAIPLVLLWHMLERRGEGRSWVGPVGCQGMGLAIAVVAWAAGRAYLVRRLQLGPMPQIEAALSGSVVREQASVLYLGYYFGLRAAWLLPIALVWDWARSRRLLALLYVLAIAPVFLAASLAFDISRIAVFAYPAVLIAVAELGRSTPQACQAYLRSAILLNAFTPVGWMMGHGGFHWRPVSPLPVRAMRAVIRVIRAWWFG